MISTYHQATYTNTETLQYTEQSVFTVYEHKSFYLLMIVNTLFLWQLKALQIKVPSHFQCVLIFVKIEILNFTSIYLHINSSLCKLC